MSVQPSNYSSYHADSTSSYRFVSPWQRELEPPLLSGAFKSNHYNSEGEEPYNTRVHAEPWRGHRRQYSDSESENYGIADMWQYRQGRQSQQYQRGRTSPMQSPHEMTRFSHVNPVGMLIHAMTPFFSCCSGWTGKRKVAFQGSLLNSQQSSSHDHDVRH